MESCRRNQAFHSREPLRSHESLKLQHSRIIGPFPFLNPTRASFKHSHPPETKPLPKATSSHESDLSSSQERESSPKEDEQLASAIEFKWRSRDNRKGRHALVINPSDDSHATYIVPATSATLRQTARGILRMFTQFPYWDISWLVATIFTLGSAVWVINAFFVWLPLVNPSTEFHNEILTGGGVTAFIGATIFEIGSVLLMFEAVNENREGCFGWALETVFAGGDEENGKVRVRPDKARCLHHHTNRKNLAGKGSVPIEPSDPTTSPSPQPPQLDHPGESWTWFPSLPALKSHYIHELGFLASLAQFLGATVFWISGFTALPGINNKLSQGALDGIYWVPQIVGGSGFIISGTLYMLETQKTWYRPAFGVLGWHIGFWNLIGALGFTLCGALGPAYGNSGAEYEASLATFWGSWAFLIGSTVQWYESLDKHPVEVMGSED